MKVLGMRPGLAAGVFGFAILFLLFLLWPITSHGHPDSQSIACLSNVKKLGMAQVMYASDHDDRFPPVDWIPAIRPYTKEARVFRCPLVPEGSSGYAYNRLLAGRKLSEKDDPTKIASVFEVDDLHLGVTADRIVPLASKRHEETLTVAFADGHGKRVRFERLRDVRVEPVPAEKK